MKKSIVIFFFAAITLFINSCSRDDGENFHFLPLQIVSADLPESFSLNEIYTISVTYNQPDSCTGFEFFEVNDVATTTRNVVAVGIRLTDTDSCIQIVEERTASFDFIVKYSEPYTFRFWQGEDENGEQQYFEVIIPVN